jgi:hypothetical protein
MPKRRLTSKTVDVSFLVARLIIEAAQSLQDDPTITVNSAWCQAIADSLTEVLDNPETQRPEILATPPYILGQDGQAKTLVEMIEHDEGNDPAKLRLTRLLLRVLDW